MLSTLGDGDVPSSQPKAHVTIETWDPRIGPIITESEVHEIQQTIRDFIGCFLFNLKELGQLKGQKVQIILKDDNPILGTLQA
jgi:hypothetical protein